MLQVVGLSKGYSAQTLFDDVNFRINDGERIGLVGRNGHGKSTLFRILTSVEEPDAGSVSISNGYRVGHLSQHLEFGEPTVLKEASTSERTGGIKNPLCSALKFIEKCLNKLAKKDLAKRLGYLKRFIKQQNNDIAVQQLFPEQAF